MKSLIVTTLLAALVGFQSALALKDSGCPPANLIRPCTCSSNNTLECKGAVSTIELRKVFEKIKGYTVSARIQSSTLQYIPHEIFKSVTLKNLYIQETSLVELFDFRPQNLNALEQLFIVNCKFWRKDWKDLASATKLKTLYIEGTEVGALNEAFSRSLPTSLEQLAIHAAKVPSIQSGVFRNLKNLNVLSIKDSGLSNLERNMFPTPFNVGQLLFSGNKLTSIPDDLFTRMPKLQIIDLSKNKLTTIPEKAFDGRARKIEALTLDDNSLNCDCNLQWLVTEKPKALSGKCHDPAKLRGRTLKGLTKSDFNC